MIRTLLRGATVIGMVPGQPDLPQADLLVVGRPRGGARAPRRG